MAAIRDRGPRLRLLVLSRNYPRPGRPALGTYVASQVKWLRRWADVHVVSPVSLTPSIAARRDAEDWRAWLRDWRRSLHALGDLKDGAAPRWFHLPKRPFEATEGLLLAGALAIQARHFLPPGWRPDLIHGHFVFPDGFAAVLLGRIWRLPVVVTGHGSDLNLLPHRSRWIRRAIRWTLRRADAVVVVSASLRREALRFGAVPDRLRVVPNGYERTGAGTISRGEARARLGVPENSKVILYVGNLFPVKGVDLLLRAFARLDGRAPDARLYLVGEGFARRQLASLTGELGLNGRVVFVGARPHREVALWIRASDVVALASRSEGWPTVVTEALALGRPVVATRVGAVPDLLFSEELGLVVEPGDERQFAEALYRGLSRGWSEAKIRALAPVRAWRDVAQELLRVYGEVVRK